MFILKNSINLKSLIYDFINFKILNIIFFILFLNFKIVNYKNYKSEENSIL